jgi:precorrin-6B methylase 2
MEKGKTVMVLPTENGMIRTGLPHIAKNDSELKKYDNQEVAIVKGSELLKDLPKIDYIKCDIEGFEGVVFKEIEPIIEKFKPFVQLEISSENKNDLLQLFARHGYQQYGISSYQFIKESGSQQEDGDYFFVPSERENDFLNRL